MSTPKSMPLTKYEVTNLLELIEAHPVVLNKVTNAVNNQLKANAWREITQTFNKTFANFPRKPETLRLKWENLKKTARKKATLKNNTLTNRAVNPEHITVDDALDRVAAILDPSFQSLPATPQPGPSQKKGKLKHRSSAVVKSSLQRRHEAIAEYYEEKRKQEAEIFELRKRKLELEIRELFLKTDP